MKKSFRAALIDVMLEIAKENSDVVILNADSARALSLTKFADVYPERMYNIGISEADMISTAAGMATTGLIPIVVGFSMFVSEKPFEQIRQSIAYPNLNVKIVATHSGLCVGQDGATHQALEDIAIIRTLPNFKIFVASDVMEEKAALKAMIQHDGPAYLRLGRDLAEDIYEDEKVVVPGGSDVLIDGNDVSILACGLMVEPAIAAASMLSKEGINAAVINMYSIKPIDIERIEEYAHKTGAFVTAEDHSVIGGLGGAVAETVAKICPTPIQMVGVQDLFGESGLQDELYEKYGLTAEVMVEKAKLAISMKK